MFQRQGCFLAAIADSFTKQQHALRGKELQGGALSPSVEFPVAYAFDFQVSGKGCLEVLRVPQQKLSRRASLQEYSNERTINWNKSWQ
jgi:hypothetical protein